MNLKILIKAFSITLLPFILFQLLYLAIFYDLKYMNSFIGANSDIIVMMFILITLFSILFIRKFYNSIEIHHNVIKDQESGVFACFFEIDINNLVNINSFSAFYSLLPFSIILRPRISKMYIILFSENLKSLSQKKKEMSSYLSVSFRHVKELRSGDLKQYVLKEIKKYDLWEKSGLNTCLLLKNENELNKVLKIVSSDESKEYQLNDFIFSFDKDTTTSKKSKNDYESHFRGLKTYCIVNKWKEKDRSELNQIIQKSIQSSNLIRLIHLPDPTDPKLDMKSGIKLLVNLIRMMKDKTTLLMKEDNIANQKDETRLLNVSSVDNGDTNETVLVENSITKIKYEKDLMKEKEREELCNSLCLLKNDQPKMCDKLLLKSYNLFKNEAMMKELKEAKLTSLDLFLDKLLNYFKDDPLQSAICFLIQLDFFDKKIFFGEKELNYLISRIDKLVEDSIVDKIHSKDFYSEKIHSNLGEKVSKSEVKL